MGWLAIAGVAISAVSAVAQGAARSREAAYQAQVAQNNSVIGERNAQYALKAGGEKTYETSLRGAAVKGRIKSAIAANNLDVNSGSAVDVEESAARSSQLDTETTAHDAALRAYGYRVGAGNDRAEAGLLAQEAEEAPIGSALGAGGSLLEKASSIGLKWQGSQV